MAVPSTSDGNISLAGIRAEITTNTYNANATTISSLSDCSDGTYGAINMHAGQQTWNDGDTPHLMSEFGGYDHDLSTFTDAYAVAKSISTGTSHAIKSGTIPAGSDMHFTQSTAFTISVWIKAGWDKTLGTNVFFWTISEPSASSWWDSSMALYYRENQNRIAFLMRSDASGSQRDMDAQWLFHSTQATYVDAYNAAGLGAGANDDNYWHEDNRGNVGNDDYTMITLVKTTSSNSNDLKLYWNASDCGTCHQNGDTSSASMSMPTNTTRELLIGSTNNGNSYIKCGNNNETKFNNFAIWDEALTAAEITAIYNSGAPMNLGSDSGNYASSANLKLYHLFENNGLASADGDLNGASYNLTLYGDSNYEAK